MAVLSLVKPKPKGETLIAAETRRIWACLLDTLARFGLAVEDVDAVVRTGGSAQIPRFGNAGGGVWGWFCRRCLVV